MTLTLPQHGLLITSVPKSGTHLLQSILTALPLLRVGPNLTVGIEPHLPREERIAIYVRNLALASETDISISHCHHSPSSVAALNLLPHKRVFLLRDPKDFIVSYIDYVLDPKSGHFHRPILAELPDDQARIECVIRGHPGRDGVRYLPSVREYYSLFWGWLIDPDTLVARYEELLDLDSCFRTIRRIARTTGVRVTDEEVAMAIRTGLQPKRSVTFRVGRSGRWRDRFSDRLRRIYEEETGDLDTRLGYSGPERTEVADP